MRTGIELTAFGRLRSGSCVSAAVVPTSSMPTKANVAIWNAATKPMNPVEKKPPSAQRCAKLARPCSLVAEQNEREAGDDECDDCDNLHHREPELGLAERTHGRQVEADEDEDDDERDHRQ